MSSQYSVSTQIGLLRKVLLGLVEGDLVSHAESIIKVCSNSIFEDVIKQSRV